MFEKLFEGMTLRKFNAIQFAITVVLAITMTLTINQLWLAYISLTLLTVRFGQLKIPLFRNNTPHGAIMPYLALSAIRGLAGSVLAIGLLRIVYYFALNEGITMVYKKPSILLFTSIFVLLSLVVISTKKTKDEEEFREIFAICFGIMSFSMVILQMYELGWVFWP